MEKKLNAIELWAENFSKSPIEICTEEIGGAFIKYCFLEMKNAVDEDGLKKLLEEKKGGLASVFWLRVKFCHTYEMSVTVAAFIGDFVLKNFAMSTMMANYMQRWAWKNNVKRITMHEVALMFPNGFPEEESWGKAWKAQKVSTDVAHGFSSDNGLDYPQLMESIKEIGKYENK